MSKLKMPFPTTAKLEIENHSWIEVTPEVFRSWTGPRRIDGKSYSGPVYNYLSNKTA